MALRAGEASDARGREATEYPPVRVADLQDEALLPSVDGGRVHARDRYEQADVRQAILNVAPDGSHH